MATTKRNAEHEGLAAAAECLKVLAHPVRLQMIRSLLLSRQKEGESPAEGTNVANQLTEELTVGDLAEQCQIADNSASEHLRLMQRCGFLTSQRDGRRVIYRIAEPHLENLMQCIENRFLNSTPS